MGIRKQGGSGPLYLAWPADLGRARSSLPTHAAFHHLSSGASPACASRRLPRPNHKRRGREGEADLPAQRTSRTPPTAPGRCSGTWPRPPPNLLIPADSQWLWDKAHAHHAHLGPDFQKAHLGKYLGGGRAPAQHPSCPCGWSLGLPQGASEGQHWCSSATTAALLLTSFRSPRFSPSPTFSMLY